MKSVYKYIHMYNVKICKRMRRSKKLFYKLIAGDMRCIAHTCVVGVFVCVCGWPRGKLTLPIGFGARAPSGSQARASTAVSVVFLFGRWVGCTCVRAPSAGGTNQVRLGGAPRTFVVCMMCMCIFRAISHLCAPSRKGMIDVAVTGGMLIEFALQLHECN